MEYLPSLQQEFDESKPSLFGKSEELSLRGNPSHNRGDGELTSRELANQGIAFIQNSSLNSNSLISSHHHSDISLQLRHIATRDTFSES